jgi:hypothetical protein
MEVVHVEGRAKDGGGVGAPVDVGIGLSKGTIGFGWTQGWESDLDLLDTERIYDFWRGVGGPRSWECLEYNGSGGAFGTRLVVLESQVTLVKEVVLLSISGLVRVPTLGMEPDLLRLHLILD